MQQVRDTENVAMANGNGSMKFMRRRIVILIRQFFYQEAKIRLKLGIGGILTRLGTYYLYLSILTPDTLKWADHASAAEDRMLNT